MSEKLNFAIREGGKTLAGVVTKIINKLGACSIGRAPVSKPEAVGSIPPLLKIIIMKNFKIFSEGTRVLE